jgi:hypothetical protein
VGLVITVTVAGLRDVAAAAGELTLDNRTISASA